jgi:hypothetical protein
MNTKQNQTISTSNGEYAHPEALVNTDWIAQYLNDRNVRIIESNEDVFRFSLQHMSPDTVTRILSALRCRKAPTRVIAIEGDDHSFVFRPRSDAIQALLEAKGRKQVATDTSAANCPNCFPASASG